MAFNGDSLPTWSEFEASDGKAKQVAAWKEVGLLILDHVASKEEGQADKVVQPMSWSDRLVLEKAELDERIKKLQAFLPSLEFERLTPESQSLLQQQVVIMRDYSGVLRQRIERI